MSWLINAEQLNSFCRNQKNIVVLDATWRSRDSSEVRKAFLAKHIPGARFFDINKLVDFNSPLPNTLLRDEEIITNELGALGIRNDSKVILYDNSDYRSSCRALWMLKMFGHSPQLLYLLDGGYPAWENQGGKTESGEPIIASKVYTVSFQQKYIRTLDQMKGNCRHPKEQVLDARHAVHFAGGPESRGGLRTGHIPGSFCFPFMVVFDKNGFFLPLEKIRSRLEGIGLNLNSPVITSCGAGITASILNFVMDILGNENNALYDGSWIEWGAETLYPGEKSLNERPVETSV